LNEIEGQCSFEDEIAFIEIRPLGGPGRLQLTVSADFLEIFDLALMEV